MTTQRRHIEFEGRVQGVGFRFTAERLASTFGLNGFVRNLPDGRVELEAQGDPQHLDDFLRVIRDELGSKIHAFHESILPTSSDTDAFVIRYS